MNKIIMGLIVAVCVLGMALIMLNEKLGRKPDPAPVTTEASSVPASEGPGGAGLSSGRPAAEDMMTSLPAPSPSPAPSLTPPPAPMAPVAEAPAAPAFSFGGETDTAPATLPPLPQTPPPAPEPVRAPAPEVDTPLPSDAPVSVPPLPEERKDVPVPSLASNVVAAHEREAAADTPRETPEKPKTTPAPGKKEEKAKESKADVETVKAATTREESRKKETPRKEAAPAREKASSADKSVERFVVYAREGGATVRIVGNANISYKPMVLTGPDRVVVDLDGDWDIKAPGIPKNDLVTNVRIGKLNGKTRVVIDLNSSAKTRYTLSKDRRMLDVRVDK